MEFFAFKNITKTGKVILVYLINVGSKPFDSVFADTPDYLTIVIQPKWICRALILVFPGLIVTSTLPKILCAGLDLNEVHGASQDDLNTFWYTLQEMWFRYTLRTVARSPPEEEGFGSAFQNLVKWIFSKK